jgi:translation elongation factor EF-G
MTANYFVGEKGEIRVIESIPKPLWEEVKVAREKLLDQVSMVSEPMMEMLLENAGFPKSMIWVTLHRTTLSLQLTPVLLGSAFKSNCLRVAGSGMVTTAVIPYRLAKHQSPYHWLNSRSMRSRMAIAPLMDGASAATRQTLTLLEVDSSGDTVLGRWRSPMHPSHSRGTPH